MTEPSMDLAAGRIAADPPGSLHALFERGRR